MKSIAILCVGFLILTCGVYVLAGQSEQGAQPVPNEVTLTGNLVELDEFLKTPRLGHVDDADDRATESPAKGMKAPIGLDTPDRVYVILASPADPSAKSITKLLEGDAPVRIKGRVFERKGLAGLEIIDVTPESGS